MDSTRTFTTNDFRKWGATGGKKARHALTSEQAKAMVAARERKRKEKKQGVRPSSQA